MNVEEATKLLNKPFYVAEELAEIGLFQSIHFVYAACKTGQLKSHKVGKKITILNRDEILEYLKDKEAREHAFQNILVERQLNFKMPVKIISYLDSLCQQATTYCGIDFSVEEIILMILEICDEKKATFEHFHKIRTKENKC